MFFISQSLRCYHGDSLAEAFTVKTWLLIFGHKKYQLVSVVMIKDFNLVEYIIMTHFASCVKIVDDSDPNGCYITSVVISL